MVSLLQDQNANLLHTMPGVIRKPIRAQPQGHFSAEDISKWQKKSLANPAVLIQQQWLTTFMITYICSFKSLYLMLGTNVNAL